MKKYLLKTISTALVAIMVISLLCSCAKRKPNKNNSSASSKVTSSEAVSDNSQSDDSSDSSDIADVDDSGIDVDPILPSDNDEPQYPDAPINPEEPDFPDEPSEPIDDNDVEDIDFDEAELRKNPIEKYGKALSANSVRTVNVDNTKVAFGDFLGYGTNSIWCGLNGDTAANYNEVLYEVDMDRQAAFAPTVARLVFQPNWIITNKETNPSRNDYKNNIDYKNYMNGVYDFNNSTVQSIIKYAKRYEKMGTEVELNFGWKVPVRIQTWFGVPSQTPYGAAPYDINAFVNATKALLNYMIKDCGIKNIKYLSFYNEPNNGGDFVTVGSSEAYWVRLSQRAREMLKSSGYDKTIELWGAEQARFDTKNSTYTVNFCKLGGSKYVDYLSVHRYNNSLLYESNYASLFDDMVYYRNLLGKRFIITETAAALIKDDAMDVKIGDDATSGKYNIRNWDDTLGAQVIAAANSGVRGVLSWGLQDGWWSDPLNDWQGGYYMLHSTKAGLGKFRVNFYEMSLLTTYIPAHSDVMQVSVAGEDVRAAVFKTKDGDYTVLLETKEGASAERDINIRFKENINKTFYRYHSDRTETVEDNCNIPVKDSSFAVQGVLRDKVASGYCMYIYTTIKPKKQITLNSVWNECNAGESVSLAAAAIDCDAGDNIKWQISAAIGKKGTVSNGTYTADAAAKSGDMIAVRAYLESDPDVMATAVIKIK